MVECARLESVCALIRTEGSNPSLSATSPSHPREASLALSEPAAKGCGRLSELQLSLRTECACQPSPHKPGHARLCTRALRTSPIPHSPFYYFRFSISNPPLPPRLRAKPCRANATTHPCSKAPRAQPIPAWGNAPGCTKKITPSPERAPYSSPNAYPTLRTFADDTSPKAPPSKQALSQISNLKSPSPHFNPSFFSDSPCTQISVVSGFAFSRFSTLRMHPSAFLFIPGSHCTAMLYCSSVVPPTPITSPASCSSSSSSISSPIPYTSVISICSNPDSQIS